MRKQKNSIRLCVSVVLLCVFAGNMLSQQTEGGADIKAAAGREAPASESKHLLGINDQITISALNVEEIAGTSTRVGMNGDISLPLVGRVKASGLTVEDLEQQIEARLKTYIKDPQVTVSLAEMRSQPVSVLGAVNRPGVHQMQGPKTLYEILSIAEGLRGDAGHSIKITRRNEWGDIPLPLAEKGPEFSVATVSVRSVMQATNPQENIPIRPHDVISVPVAELVYVIGEVRKSGGFVLKDQETLSVLQALSLAEGLAPTAAPGSARILRPSGPANTRIEIPINVKELLAGKMPDIPLQANDILFVPNSPSKKMILRSLEAALQIGTGVVVYRR